MGVLPVLHIIMQKVCLYVRFISPRNGWRFFAQVLEALASYLKTQREPPNLFGVYYGVEPMSNLWHWVERAQKNFAPVAPYCQNPPLHGGPLNDPG
ncbi:hypothetical protein AVEN_103225-1 [Araneus ventricosus]|uniref:Uncharacterized protein n=1 Tax=Araneus ventricosus TaxID=182803 RepID=A0A4Y2F9I5_ARAVE|nr:hypothetical protein AVEN_103225-1 [Araneus ventricosus]